MLRLGMSLFSCLEQPIHCLFGIGITIIFILLVLCVCIHLFINMPALHMPLEITIIITHLDLKYPIL